MRRNCWRAAETTQRCASSRPQVATLSRLPLLPPSLSTCRPTLCATWRGRRAASSWPCRGCQQVLQNLPYVEPLSPQRQKPAKCAASSVTGGTHGCPPGSGVVARLQRPARYLCGKILARRFTLAPQRRIRRERGRGGRGAGEVAVRCGSDRRGGRGAGEVSVRCGSDRSRRPFDGRSHFSRRLLAGVVLLGRLDSRMGRPRPKASRGSRCSPFRPSLRQ